MASIFQSKTLKILLGLVILAGVFLILFVFPTISLTVHRPIKNMCLTAREEYPGDCVEALIAYIESDHHSYQDKNQAIWALGGFGDRRAVPILERLYTGEACGKPCRKDLYICQYELEKAIRFSKKGTLLSPWIRLSLLE